MDASKAFDKVNHYHLLVKLIERKVPILIIRLLYYWFTHQEFAIRWGNSVSSFFRVKNGVRQGGILSPIFFNVYLDLLSMILSNSSYGCTINDYRVNHLFYADDAVILAPSPHALQQLIDLCVTYASDYELSFNVKKTKVMCFTPKAAPKLQVPDFFLNGCVLEKVSFYKYLGVLIDCDYADNKDIQRQIRSIYQRGNILTRKFSMCSSEVKTCLFKSYCTSFYCSQLWSNHNSTCFKKLKSSFNRILRSLFNIKGYHSMSGFCLQLGIDSFNVTIRKCIFNFRTRLLSCDNEIVKSIIDSVFFMTSSLTNYWNYVLFTF